jgi:hypothetical protein
MLADKQIKRSEEAVDKRDDLLRAQDLGHGGKINHICDCQS